MNKDSSTIVPPKTFPHCIVWTPIPLISWLVPLVGHMGVCSSRGLIMVSIAWYRFLQSHCPC